MFRKPVHYLEQDVRIQSGQTIIELLLAFAISLIFLPALFTMFFVSREGRGQEVRRTQAVGLMREAEDIVRSIREKGWDQFVGYGTGIGYHPVRNGNTWALANNAESILGFTRSVTFFPVNRDTSGAIVTGGGTPDPSTRKVTVTVSWSQPFPSSVTSVSYITRHENIIITDTTDTDFNAGTHANTKSVVIDDGEVVLGNTGGYGDWCSPNLSLTALDLPKSGVANAISAIQGQIAVGTGENASGVSYANVQITDPAFPTTPVASISGTFDGYKTNDVFTEQDYAYLATDNNAKEIEIINLTSRDANGKYSEAGYFDAPGNGNGSTVFTSGTTGYMIFGSTLYAFDLTTKTGSRPQVGSLALPGSGQRIMVAGSIAYIATSATNAQLVMVNITTPAAMSIQDTVGLDAAGAKAVFVNSTGTRAYVATAASTTKREFFIVNTEPGSSTYKQVLGSYDTNGMDPKGVAVVSGPRAILVGAGAEEYQVLDITNEYANPLPHCGGINIDSGVNGISTVFTSQRRAYSYIITGDASTELKIIEGGSGGGNGADFGLTGRFESRAIDIVTVSPLSSQAAFNRITATLSENSAVTGLTLQVAGADPVGGSCGEAAYVFVGPDGTEGSMFTSPDGVTITGSIPFHDDGSGYENPARCFKYRAYLSTTDASLTPLLKDVTVSFSP